jgi:hypothetical protein
MSSVWEIRNNHDEPVGSIDFSDSAHLRGVRTLTGFELYFPARLTLNLLERGQPLPLLTGIGGRIAVSGAQGSAVDIGKLETEWYHSAGYGKGVSTSDHQVIWRGSYVDLVAYEKIRAGGTPQFRFMLRGELCYLVPSELPRFSYRTHPQSLFTNIEVKYERETWIKVLRDLRIRENVLIEVPLTQSPAKKWDEVWKAVVEARNYFEQGGDIGWKGCVASVRLALEKWHKIEPEDQGLPNWKAPSREVRDGRSKQDRLHSLRWHLLQLANLSPHTHAETWTREDAVLLLSTLSSLLAEKHS